MKKACLLLPLVLCCIVQLFAQKTEPLIIKGQLKNFPEDKLYLFWYYDKGIRSDTVDVDTNGNFYLKTYKVTKPALSYFRKQGSFYTDLFIAPGYNLTITADCKDFKDKPTKLKKVTGEGSASNEYLFTRDSIFIARNISSEKPALNLRKLLAFENAKTFLTDSIANKVFQKQLTSDKYQYFFEKMVRLDIKYERLDILTDKAAHEKSLNYQQTKDFILKNGGNHAFDSIYDEINLISRAYVVFLRDGYYNYLRYLACKRDSSECSNINYAAQCVKIIANNYQGAIKQTTLYNLMFNTLRNLRSFEEMLIIKRVFPQYISTLQDTVHKQQLNELLANKANELLITQTGKPAPAFTAVDSTGKQYSIADFKGKVVIIDLWGSWCKPCRVLTPYFKTLVEKYKTDPRVAFVSISVFDEDKKWRRAMREDKPTWLQLLDNKGSVHTNYVANSVPKFVVINKQGNITTFDAPISNSFSELKKIINVEVEK